MPVAITVTQQNQHTAQYKHKQTHSLLQLHVITNTVELSHSVHAQEIHKDIFSGERKLKVT